MIENPCYRDNVTKEIRAACMPDQLPESQRTRLQGYLTHFDELNKGHRIFYEMLSVVYSRLSGCPQSTKNNENTKPIAAGDLGCLENLLDEYASVHVRINEIMQEMMKLV